MSQPPKYTNPPSQTLYETAIRLIKAGNTVAARTALDMLYQNEPIDLEKHLLYAASYIFEGQYKTALPYLQTASNDALKDNLEFLYLSGCAYYESKDIQKATPFFMRIIEVNPSHISALVHLGHIHLQSGALEKAEQYYLNALDEHRKKPKKEHINDEPNILSGLARIYHQQDDIERAIGFMQNALELDSSTQNHSYLGRLFLQTGRHDQGLEQHRMALTLAPANPVYWGNYAVALRRSGESHDWVLQAVNKALELGPENALLHVQAASTLNRIEFPDKADAVYKKALTLAGEDTNQIKSYLCGSWRQAIRQNRPYHFTAERLADLCVPVAVPHAPLISYGR